MNHIARLTMQRDDAGATVAAARGELESLLCYLLSDKFSGPDADYVHVRTDLLPRLATLRAVLAR